MANCSTCIQDILLNTLVRDNVLCMIQLVNANQIVGRVQYYDNSALAVISNDNRMVIIFKDAIAFITPFGRVDMCRCNR